MRAILTKLRERAHLFATHMVTHSFGSALSVPLDEDHQQIALRLIETLTDWLSFEEGHPEEWQAYVTYVNTLNELSQKTGQDLVELTALMRLLFQFERHLISLSSPNEQNEAERLRWRRRYLSACEKIVTLCEVRQLFKAMRSPQWSSTVLDLLSSLAFEDQTTVLHESLLSQMEVRFTLNSALSSRHLYTLSSDRLSWWLLSLSQLFKHQQIYMLSLSVFQDSPWDPLQQLVGKLLQLHAVYGKATQPEHQILKQWAEPLTIKNPIMVWLEELSPRSRVTWLKRSLHRLLYELSVELDVRLCIFISHVEYLSEELAQVLVDLLTVKEQGRESRFLMIAQHEPKATLPQSILALDHAQRSSLPQQSLLEWTQLDRDPILTSLIAVQKDEIDLAIEWEMLWLLSLTEQVIIKDHHQLALVWAESFRRHRSMSELSHLLWEGFYLALPVEVQKIFKDRLWSMLICEHIVIDEAALYALSTRFGGIKNSPKINLWAPIERIESIEMLLSRRTLSEKLAYLDQSEQQSLRENLAFRLQNLDLTTCSFGELHRCHQLLSEDLRHPSWIQLAESTAQWWGLGITQPLDLQHSFLGQQDHLQKASSALLHKEYDQAEELLAMALSRGEKGGAYWRSVRSSFGLLCWWRGEQEEANLFLDEVLSRPPDPRWGARLQARALLVKGMILLSNKKTREASLYLYGASRVARSIGDLGLIPYSGRLLSTLALQVGSRSAGLILLEDAYQSALEQGLDVQRQIGAIELSFWALHYGAYSLAHRYLKTLPQSSSLRNDLVSRQRMLAQGLHAIHDRAWGDALNILGQLVDLDQKNASYPLEKIEQAYREITLEAQLFMGVALIESDSTTASLVRAQNLAREVRLDRAVSVYLALFARYLEIRIVCLQPFAEHVKSRELTSRLYELREDWGARCSLGELSLNEALLYTLSGVEVGSALGSVMEQLTELEPLQGYFEQARAELMEMGWLDTLTQRWELQRARSLLPQNGSEVSWLG